MPPAPPCAPRSATSPRASSSSVYRSATRSLSAFSPASSTSRAAGTAAASPARTPCACGSYFVCTRTRAAIRTAPCAASRPLCATPSCARSPQTWTCTTSRAVCLRRSLHCIRSVGASPSTAKSYILHNVLQRALPDEMLHVGPLEEVRRAGLQRHRPRVRQHGPAVA